MKLRVVDANRSAQGVVSGPGKRLLVPVLGISLATAATIWWLHAPSFFTVSQATYRDHWPHAFWMLLHVVGGTGMLFTGPFLLWSGFRRRVPKVHRWVGRLYLVTGVAGAASGGVLSVIANHEPRALFVATFFLSITWLLVAGMAYRAIRNRRIEAHREWVIRSYVLTWTFVFCRLAMKTPVFGFLGIEGVTATVWMSWVMPLIVTEIMLQWRRTGPQPGTLSAGH